MNETFFVKPSPGLQVRDPVSFEPLPEAGAVKPRDNYWLRRANDGDVYELPQTPKNQTDKA